MTNRFDDFFAPVAEMVNFGTQLAKGAETISRISHHEVDVGATPKTQVAQIDKVTLHHYKPIVEGKPKTEPVLIVYGLIGRYTMIDLQEDRSLVRNLLARGVDLYVVDWGYPSRADQFLTFDDYVSYYLDECVQHICQAHGLDSISLLGICEGGVFATMYAAHYPSAVKNLMVSITPIDFSADTQDDDPSHGFLNLWTRNMEDDDIEGLIDAFGNLPGELMGAVFQALTPVRSMTKYNVDLADIAADDAKLLNFLRMEKWLADRPHHPGAAAKQWLIQLYKDNQMVKGQFQLSGRAVNLNDITMPVLNIYAERDHIIPPPCSTALSQHISSDDYTEIALPGGHVGVYVSSRLQGIVGDGIFDWLTSRQ